jgi:hypothetical protein
MARTVTVTKRSVTTGQDGLFSITLNLLYKEDAAILLDQDFAENYWTGQAPSLVTAKVKERMQKAIDNYKACETIFNAAALNTAVTTLQNGLAV